METAVWTQRRTKAELETKSETKANKVSHRIKGAAITYPDLTSSTSIAIVNSILVSRLRTNANLSQRSMAALRQINVAKIHLPDYRTSSRSCYWDLRLLEDREKCRNRAVGIRRCSNFKDNRTIPRVTFEISFMSINVQNINRVQNQKAHRTSVCRANFDATS